MGSKTDVWLTTIMAPCARCVLALCLPASATAQAPPAASEVFRSFDHVLLLEEKGETSAGVNLGDLNGDGLLDIVLGKGRHWPLYNRVLLNVADDDVQVAVAIDVGQGRGIGSVWSVAKVARGEKQAAFLIVNQGKRHFAKPKRLPSPPRAPYALAVADLNRDGRPDIVVGNVEMPGSVYFNTGHAHSWHEVRWNDGKGTVYGMAFADFNGDGWPDIVAARSDAPNAIWFSTEPMPGR